MSCSRPDGARLVVEPRAMLTPRPCVLVTGATGYLGRALVPLLLRRGHTVRVLVRPGSEAKVPAGAEVIVGDALQAQAVGRALEGVDTVVHLVGVPKPSPAKAQQFREVDLVSVLALADAIQQRASRRTWFTSASRSRHP